jgi:hypothetical protein
MIAKLIAKQSEGLGQKKDHYAKIGHYCFPLMLAGARKYAFWPFAKPRQQLW